MHSPSSGSQPNQMPFFLRPLRPQPSELLDDEEEDEDDEDEEEDEEVEAALLADAVPDAFEDH